MSLKTKLFCALFAASLAAPAAAGDTATLAISANVNGTCKFTTGSFTMNFGVLDPSAAANQAQATTFETGNHFTHQAALHAIRFN